LKKIEQRHSTVAVELFFSIAICWLYVLFIYFQSKEGKNNTKKIHNMNGVCIPWCRSCHIDFAGKKKSVLLVDMKKNILKILFSKRKRRVIVTLPVFSFSFTPSSIKRGNFPA